MRIQPPSPHPWQVLIPDSLLLSSRLAAQSPGAHSSAAALAHGAQDRCPRADSPRTSALLHRGSSPTPAGGQGSPVPNPTGAEERLPLPPALSPRCRVASPKLCQGWDSLGHQAHPTAGSGYPGQAGLPAPRCPAHPGGTVPGRQPCRLGGQRSAVSCPVEIKRKQRRVKDPGASGMSGRVRQKAGASSPPPSCPSLSCLQCLPLRLHSILQLLPHTVGWSTPPPASPDTLKTSPREGGSLQHRARAGAPPLGCHPASAPQHPAGRRASPPLPGTPQPNGAWDDPRKGRRGSREVPRCQPCCQGAIYLGSAHCAGQTHAAQHGVAAGHGGHTAWLRGLRLHAQPIFVTGLGRHVGEQSI